MGTDRQILDELRGAVTDMAAVVATLAWNLPEDEWRRLRDRLRGMETCIERANALAASHGAQGVEGK